MTAALPEAPGVGALVISLDFELHWGVRDWTAADGPYAENLEGTRAAISMILDAFREFDVAATWATVGFLFASGPDELRQFRPATLPAYQDRSLFPYDEPVGEDEAQDPLHFGRSLIEMIDATPRQEIASHTYSHYYCLAPGQDAVAFAADMDAAVRIALHCGVDVRSVVFPRNQFNGAYAEILRQRGIKCYRGQQEGWIHRCLPTDRLWVVARLARLVDTYVNLTGHSVTRWSDLHGAAGLCNVAASRFLRPYAPTARRLEPHRRRRVVQELEYAARSKGIFHLWWHPHNFGKHPRENVDALRALLGQFARLRSTHGMESMTMLEVAERFSPVSAGDEGAAQQSQG